MDIVLFGIQGSGKGTQGAIIAEKYNLKVFETGAQLRALAKEDSPLGNKVKEIIEAGKLVPTEVVMEIIEDFTQKLEPGQNSLFDGIPRKEDQRIALDSLLEKLGRSFKGVLIDISLDEAMRRLTTRRICEGCKKVFPAFYEEATCDACGGNLITRADDNAESIKARLEAYEQETKPCIDFYESEGKIVRINGEQSIEGVSKEVLEKLDPIFA